MDTKLSKRSWTILGSVAVLMLLLSAGILAYNVASTAKYEKRVNADYQTTTQACVEAADYYVAERRAGMGRVDSEVLTSKWNQLVYDSKYSSPRTIDTKYGGADALCAEVWELAQYPRYYQYPYPIPYPYYDYGYPTPYSAMEGDVARDDGYTMESEDNDAITGGGTSSGEVPPYTGEIEILPDPALVDPSVSSDATTSEACEKADEYWSEYSEGDRSVMGASPYDEECMGSQSAID